MYVLYVAYVAICSIYTICTPPRTPERAGTSTLWRSLLMIVSIAYIEQARLDTYQTSVGGRYGHAGKRVFMQLHTDYIHTITYRFHMVAYRYIQITYSVCNLYVMIQITYSVCNLYVMIQITYSVCNLYAMSATGYTQTLYALHTGYIERTGFPYISCM